MALIWPSNCQRSQLPLLAVIVCLSYLRLQFSTDLSLASEGFCEDDGQPWGVDIGASVGVDLGIEAWKELDGDKDSLYEATLFEKPDLFEFPSLCMGSDEVSEDYCPAEPDPDDVDEVPVPPELEESESTKRDLDGFSELAKRQGKSSRTAMYATCARKDEKWPIVVLDYKGPEELKLVKEVPIFKPAVHCAPKTRRRCRPDTKITKITGDSQQRSTVRNQIHRDNKPESKTKRTWASTSASGPTLLNRATNKSRVRRTYLRGQLDPGLSQPSSEKNRRY